MRRKVGAGRNAEQEVKSVSWKRCGTHRCSEPQEHHQLFPEGLFAGLRVAW